MESSELPLLADSVISELFNVVGFTTNGTDNILDVDTSLELRELDCPSVSGVFGGSEESENTTAACSKNDAENFPCGFCSKIFSRKSNMIRHRISCISKEARKSVEKRQHCCSICRKSFKKPAHLKRHLTTHSKIRQFRCENCSKCFTQKAHLNRHLEEFHKEKNGNEGEMDWKPLECNECGKKFGRESDLRRHMKSRKQPCFVSFKCTFCDAIFETNDACVSHIQWHVGERAYNCSHCGKAFKQKCDLKNHLATHSNKCAKNFICLHCQREFNQRTEINRHMAKIHPLPTGAFSCPECSSARSSARSENNSDCSSARSSAQYENNSDSSAVGFEDSNHSAIRFEDSNCSVVRFADAEKLAQHFHLIHRQNEAVVCRFCANVFGSRFDCATHISSVHFRRIK